jgi:hypothetical protein
MIDLYLFKCVDILNITNLPMWLFYLSRTDLYDPCSPVDFSAAGRLGLVPSDFPKLFVPDDKIFTTFRDTYWPDQIHVLNKILANNPGKKIALGVNHVWQADFFKNYYQTRTFILGCSYDDDETYNLLLTYLAKCHLYQQSIGVLPITDHDRLIRLNNSDNLIETYKAKFDELNLIPRSIDPVGDYEIPVKDFFNFEKLSQHMANAGTPLLPPAINYYNSWQQKLREWSNL